MECQEFLEGYSEYLDGRLDEEGRAAFRAHRDACTACERYDRVVRRGLTIWRNLPQLEPSPDFLPRLQHRLYHVDDAERLSMPRPLGSAALVAVGIVGFLALAWLPFATRMSVEVQLPAVAVEAPEGAREVPSSSLFGRGPFLAPEPRSPSPHARPAARSVDGPADLFDPYYLHSLRGGAVRSAVAGDVR